MGVFVLALIYFIPLGFDIPRGLKQFLLAPLLAFAFHYGAFFYGYRTGSVATQVSIFVTLVSWVLLASFKVNYFYVFNIYELILMCLVNGGSFLSGSMCGARCRGG